MKKVNGNAGTITWLPRILGFMILLMGVCLPMFSQNSKQSVSIPDESIRAIRSEKSSQHQDPSLTVNGDHSDDMVVIEIPDGANDDSTISPEEPLYADDNDVEVAVSGKRWSWVNPSPQGNTLYASDLYRDSGFCAVGALGTLVSTTDRGSSWRVLPSIGSSSSRLTSVDFVDSNTGYAAATLGKVFKTTDGGDTWSLLTTGTSVPLMGIKFTSVDRGWVIGYGGKVLRTTNGGTTWTTQVVTTFNRLWSIDFADSLNGWVVGDSGAIFHTTNGGSFWGQQTSGLTQHLNAVRFSTLNRGYAAGNDGRIVRTTNGGATWQLRYTASGISLQSITVAAFDSSTAWVVGQNGRIVKTSDGGQT